MKSVLLDVYHRADRPRGWGRFVRSWDGRIYFEAGIAGPQVGFAPPSAGPDRRFVIKNVGSGYALANHQGDGKIPCHCPVTTDRATAEKLIAANS